MNTLFSFPMDSIMRVMLGAFVAITLVVAVLALRNRLFVKLGLRNLPRRRAQSTLIIFGLMLSTLIVTAAFTAGDTFSYSIRSSAAAGLGGVDEIIGNTPKQTDRSAPTAIGFLPASAVNTVQAAVNGGHAVDGVTGAMIQLGAIQDLSSRQTKAGADMSGVPAHYPNAFGTLTSTSGSTVTLQQLGANEIYLNQEAAGDLNAHAGDRLRLYVDHRSVTVTVRAIVQNNGLAGGGLLGNIQIDPVVLMPLERLQTISGHPGQITHILVSNQGDVLSGAALTGTVDRQLHASGLGYHVENIKQDALNGADRAGTEFTTGFIAFGLFSITASVMLIFMIFVMLAAERRSEMGMARAVGTKRRHLIQQFLFEGFVYDLGAALVGVLLGILVGLGIVSVLSVLASNAGFFQLQRHIEPRSVVVAFCLGALVTFVTVVISSWRVSRLNVVAAIRDLPDDPTRDGGVRGAFVRPFADLGNAGRRLRRGRILSGLRALIAAPWHLITAFRVFISRGPLLLLAGYFLLSLGSSSKQLFPFDLGISLLLVGSAMLLRWILGGLRVPDRIRNRLSYSLAGLALIVFWLLPFDFFRSDLQFGVEMFVLSGIMLTLGGVWTAMYNIDLVLGGLLLIAGGVGRWTPVLKTAVTYPMQHRFRTGMTLFMFSLVMFALMVQAVVVGSFGAGGLDLNRDIGGYQVYGQTSPGTPVRNVAAQVSNNPSLRGRVSAAGGVGVVTAQLSQPGAGGQVWQNGPVGIADNGYLTSTHFTLHSRATGYATDAQIWKTLRSHPDYAVVDSSLVPTKSGGAGGNGGFRIHGFYYEDKSFKPVKIQMADTHTGRTITLTVIGVLDQNAQRFSTTVLYTSQSTLRAAHEPVPAPTMLYFRVTPGQDVHRTALAVGAAFLSSGLEIHEAQVEYNKMQSLGVGFNNLLEGFMALGLVVGIAALGVIATRSVVERRQQIGMLRAIGFKRRMVQATFLLESSFITILASVVSMVLGILLGVQVVNYFGKTDPTLHAVIPWAEVVLIVIGAYVASLLTTYLPAWQASRVYPAEALRYE